MKYQEKVLIVAALRELPCIIPAKMTIEEAGERQDKYVHLGEVIWLLERHSDKNEAPTP